MAWTSNTSVQRRAAGKKWKGRPWALELSPGSESMAQPFISLVTLGKLLNLSGPYSTFASEIPLDKERAQSQITLAELWKEETFWNNLEGQDGVGGGKEVQERRDISMPVAESCGCLAEGNTIL